MFNSFNSLTTTNSINSKGATMTNQLISSNTDLIENPSARCACVVVLDTSVSMNGSAITELNEGLQYFINSVKQDEMAAYSVDLAVITAGGDVSIALPFTSVQHIDTFQKFPAAGGTPLGTGVDLALDMLENRKEEYRQNGIAYYQPWMVIISDGIPTDEWVHIAARAKKLAADKKLVSLPIGVENADLTVLSQFSNRAALKLNGLEFTKFFEWLSKSMSRVSQSASTTSSVDLPPIDSWASI